MGNDRWALMQELRGQEEPSLDYLLQRMQHCDIVLIEGFKNGGFPKIEVWRESVGKPKLWPQWPGIQAIASDASTGEDGVTSLAIDNIAAIADFVLRNAQKI